MLNVCGYDSYVIRGSDEHGLQGMKENSNIFRSSITVRRSRFVSCISRHFEFVIRERSNGLQGQYQMNKDQSTRNEKGCGN